MSVHTIYLLLLVLLGGCAAVPATTPPPTLPSLRPTTAATTAPTSTVLPTPTPAPARLLPAPLYVLAEQQIWRVPADGSAPAQITREADFVVEFGVSPASGNLAYVIGQNQYNGDSLVLSDGQGTQRRVLLADTPGVSHPRWLPTGSLLAFARGATPDFSDPGGIYLLDTSDPSASPVLLLANPPLDPNNPPIGEAYEPVLPLAWSPTGEALLIQQGFALAVLWRDQGTVVPLQHPMPAIGRLPCCDAAWYPAGDALVVASQGNMVLGSTAPGLWRANARTGTAALLDTGYPDSYTLALSPYANAEQIGFFAAPSNEIPPPGSAAVPLTMHTLDAPASVLPVRADAHALREAYWAPDLQGAAVLAVDSSAAQTELVLLWLERADAPPPPIELFRFPGDQFVVTLQGASPQMAWGK